MAAEERSILDRLMPQLARCQRQACTLEWPPWVHQPHRRPQAGNRSALPHGGELSLPLQGRDGERTGQPQTPSGWSARQTSSPHIGTTRYEEDLDLPLANLEQHTPLMQQFLRIKAQHPDTLVLFRM